MQVDLAPSPNFNDRKHPVDMLVLHYTGMDSGDAALARMRDPASEVSAHYMVWEDGRITQLVGADKRAWHAGVSSWQGDDDLNSRSIGVEIELRSSSPCQLETTSTRAPSAWRSSMAAMTCPCRTAPCPRIPTPRSRR